MKRNADNEIDTLIDYIIGRCKDSKCMSLCSSLIFFCTFVACCGGLIYVLHLSHYTASVIGLVLIGTVCLVLSLIIGCWFGDIFSLALALRAIVSPIPDKSYPSPYNFPSSQW
ncbi:hypothetical protein TNIN_136741 [Trichonephila inaurata madagascariensis]|uniref:Uncharacterized protein n=1 Tax=Trichonephila inaurata madagascariensis TaxID=2747483 RepID=A0A8X6X6Y4_9ARAC|nr:hypothetical protein TNIN_136741 [Trichonephila inaurata madagascariensis]